MSICEYQIVRDEKTIRELVGKEIERTGGIFRLAPTWVGRTGIVVPGRRIKLEDIYLNQAVAVNERWLASVTYADNGVSNAVCPQDHGFSYLVVDRFRFLLRDAFRVVGDVLLGKGKEWDVLPKFFDNNGRIPSHLHPCQQHVKKGLIGKPESYHFPRELNMNPNSDPRTTLGIDPTATDDDILNHLRGYKKGNNRLTDLGCSINLIPGTGYYMPPCTLHGPGSFVTYELQVASDVSCIPESRVNEMVMPVDMVDRDLPVTFEKDGEEAVYQYILSMIRCEQSGNTVVPFRKEYFRPPVRVRDEASGYQDFVIYRTGKCSEPVNPDLYSAKHTVVYSQENMEMNEHAAFGLITLGGHGTLSVPGKEPVSLETVGIFVTRESMGGDEVFVSAPAASHLIVEGQSMEDVSFYQHFSSHSNLEAARLSIPE
ncbi:MAG: hypothetical protein NTX88_03190 [Candidatus Atribacteria bacterium]|nr:hypothetical protein [Candidatus Atribacteria bacterium]